MNARMESGEGHQERRHDAIDRLAAELADLEEHARQVKVALVPLVVAEAARGVPLAVIGRRIGKSRETIRRWIKEAGREDLVRPSPARRSP